MSVYYSSYGLNARYGTPYFQANVPQGFPYRLLLQKSRAWRRLPPNLKLLSELSKEWAEANGFCPDDEGYRSHYDDEGYELDPSDGHRLTDAEIDAQWQDNPQLDGHLDALSVTDVPMPATGFPDPNTWELPPEEPSEPDPDDVPTNARLLSDLESRGVAAVSETYGIPQEQLRKLVATNNSFCATGKGGGIKPDCSPGEKADREKFTGKSVGWRDREAADAAEKHVASVLGHEHESDLKFYDTKSKNSKHFVEVKTMLKGEKQVVNAHPDALPRKVEGVAAYTGAVFHTVVVDQRDSYDGGQHAENYSGHGLYYKRGNGRYALSQMHPVKSDAELKRLVRAKDEDLPEKARGSLPSGKEIKSLRVTAAKEAESRKARNARRRSEAKAEGRNIYERQT